MKLLKIIIIILLLYAFGGLQGNAQLISGVQIDSIGLTTDVNDTSQIVITDSASPSEKTSLRERIGGPPPLSEIISIPKILWSIVLIIIGYLGIRITSRAVEIFAEKNPRYRFTIKGVVPIIKIFGWMLIIIIIIAGGCNDRFFLLYA